MAAQELRHGCGADDETEDRRFELPVPQPREARAVEPPVEVLLVNTRYSDASVCAGMVSRVCAWALGVPKKRELAVIRLYNNSH